MDFLHSVRCQMDQQQALPKALSMPQFPDNSYHTLEFPANSLKYGLVEHLHMLNSRNLVFSLNLTLYIKKIKQRISITFQSHHHWEISFSPFHIVTQIHEHCGYPLTTALQIVLPKIKGKKKSIENTISCEQEYDESINRNQSNIINTNNFKKKTKNLQYLQSSHDEVCNTDLSRTCAAADVSLDTETDQFSSQ